MDFQRQEQRRDRGGASFSTRPSSSFVGKSPSDAGLSRYGIGASGSNAQRDQTRPLSYDTDSAFRGRGIGSPGPSVQGPLPTPSYCGDLELENRRLRLREIADRVELTHYRLLEDYDRRALASAEKSPYARRIPLYPKLPSHDVEINCIAQMAPPTLLQQKVDPIIHELPGERKAVQKDLNMGPLSGPHVGAVAPQILRREEAVPHERMRFFPEIRDRARPFFRPIGSVGVVRLMGPAQDARLDERPAHDLILQNRLAEYNMMVPPRVMHEPPPSLAVPVPVQVQSSSDNHKKRKKEYGQDVIEVRPTVLWSKFLCLLCNLNFDSKDAMDAHLQEQHELRNGGSCTKSEKVEKKESGETDLAAKSKDDHKELSEGGTDTIKKIQLDLPPSNINQKSNKSNKEEVVPTPEDKEIAGSCTIKKIKLDLPPSGLKQKFDKPNSEGVVLTPENKEIADSSTNKKIQLHLPPWNLKQKSIEPSKKSLPTAENKETAGSSTHITTGHKKESATENVKALPNGSQKSEPTSKLVQDKPVQGASQALSVPKLVERKEETSKSVPMPQSDKLKVETSQDKGNPSSSAWITIPTGHKKIAQPTPKFSDKKSYIPVTGTTNPFLIMKDGKWFCNLCQAKLMSEKNKEQHINGKRHKQNLQSQSVFPRPEPAQPLAYLHRCYVCNIRCTTQEDLSAHFKGRKHREVMEIISGSALN